MRRLNRSLLAGAALALCAGCAGEQGPPSSIDALDAPAVVRAFLGRQDMGRFFAYRTLAEDAGSGTVVFNVGYSGADGCTVCGFPAAYGVAVGGRIGWLAPLPTGGQGTFDFVASDTALYSQRLWAAVRAADSAGSIVFRSSMAADPDVPLPVLRQIAQSLSSSSSFDFSPDSTVAAALLTNPLAGNDRDVLLPLAARGGFVFGTWSAVQAEAWRRLKPLVAPLGKLALEARIMTDSLQVYPSLVLRNTSDLATVVVGGALCAPVIRIYSDAAYTRLVWDAAHWPGSFTAGGCKLPAARSLVPGNGLLSIATGRVIRASDILGDSLAAGTYFATVPMTLSTPAGDTTAEPRAGAVTLTR